MADPIKFTVILRSRHARRAYQVHRFAQCGGVIASRIITASNDVDAKRQAAGLAAGDRAELWANNYLVAVFGTFASPVATSIRLLADRPATGL